MFSVSVGWMYKFRFNLLYEFWKE